jgi:NADPH:quinone reductase-like Zn-dependent oxidoreductase
VRISRRSPVVSIKPVLDRVFSLAETAEALHFLATDEVRGKVVVTVASG